MGAVVVPEVDGLLNFIGLVLANGYLNCKVTGSNPANYRFILVFKNRILFSKFCAKATANKMHFWSIYQLQSMPSLGFAKLRFKAFL